MDVIHAVKAVPLASPCDWHTVHVKRLGVAGENLPVPEGAQANRKTRQRVFL